MKFYDLTKMNQQEVFNACAQHLLTQQAKSEDHNYQGICLYYEPITGRQCAAGIFIPSRLLLSGKIERTDWYNLTLQEKVPNNHQKLISVLQDIHDFSTPETWELNLRAVARYFKLEFSVSINREA